MERREIPIRFADLRRLAREVPAYLARQAGESLVLPLSSGIEDELSVAGLDTEELILGFAKNFGVEITSFDFTDFISADDVSPVTALLTLPITACLLAGWLLKITTAGLCWLWHPALAGHIWRWQLPLFGQTAGAPRALTVGDFVASAAVGRFMLRGQVRFQLVRA